MCILLTSFYVLPKFHLHFYNALSMRNNRTLSYRSYPLFTRLRIKIFLHFLRRYHIIITIYITITIYIFTLLSLLTCQIFCFYEFTCLLIMWIFFLIFLVECGEYFLWQILLGEPRKMGSAPTHGALSIHFQCL